MSPRLNSNGTIVNTLRSSIIFAVFLIAGLPDYIKAQQMIVDDAAVADEHAFEVWGGTEESIIQPSIVFSEDWNVGPGIVFNTSNQNIEATNWFIESKLVPANWRNENWATGNVSGILFDFDGNPMQIYSYIPISKNILNPSSFLHLNLGMEGNHFPGDWDYAFTSGVRADLALSNRVIFLSEIYSANFESTSFHTGFKFVIIPGQFESDITYGRGFEENVTYPGFTIGVSFTP